MPRPSPFPSPSCARSRTHRHTLWLPIPSAPPFSPPDFLDCRRLRILSPKDSAKLTAPQEAGNHNSSTPTASSTPTPTTATTLVPPTPASAVTARKAPDQITRQDTAPTLVSRDKDAHDGPAKPSATNIAQPAHSPSSNPGVDPLSQVRPSTCSRRHTAGPVLVEQRDPAGLSG